MYSYPMVYAADLCAMMYNVVYSHITVIPGGNLLNHLTEVGY